MSYPVNYSPPNYRNQPTTSSPPNHAYLSALRDLTGENEADIRKKRESQQAFAESLRRQIEEKRRAQNNKANHYTFGQDYEPSINQFANQPSGIGTSSPDFSTAVSITPEPVPQARTKPKRMQIINRADLTQFDKFATVKEAIEPKHRSIPISNDSPFINSTVPTPPQGFSMRGLPIVEPTQTYAPKQINLPPTSLSPPPEKKTKNVRFQKQEPLLTDSFILQAESVGAKNHQSRAKSSLYPPPKVVNNVRLGAKSELIYPDGHMSPISTPREDMN